MDARKARPCGRAGRWAVWALAAALAWPAAQAAERVALVIGNAAYEHTDALRNPGNDADALAAALRRLGFEVVLGKDLDTDGFYDTLGAFDEASRGADVTLFFYAGHGLQVQGRNWLAPVDAKLESRLDLERGAVELDTVLEHMRGTKKLVFLDACRNNPLAGDLARTLGLSRTATTSRGLARVQSGSGTLIGYATAPDDVAADGDGRNSPFTEALLAHIETPGLSVNDMFGEVSEAVSRATGGKQVPWSHSSLGRFYLASAATPTAGGTPAPSSGDTARAYEAAERLNTVAAYRAFIRRFPGSYEAELAQGHIDKLVGKPQPIVVAGGDDEDDATPVTPPPPTPSPEAVERRLGLSREESRQVQMGLAAAGHDPGPADGWIGAGTREAIRRWQEAQGRPATGYLDADGAKALLASGKREAERSRAEAERKKREAEARRVAEAAERQRAREAEERRRAEAEEAARRARAEAERQRKEREAEERRKRAREPGDKFRDCPGCPEMVVVPGGPSGLPFAVGVYEVTRGEYGRFVLESRRSTGSTCWIWDGWASLEGAMKERSGRNWKSPGYGQTDEHPVVCVNLDDAQAYVQWLSGRTGHEYRLLSEAEWEYVARAGTTTAYWWGNDIGRNRANCGSCGDSYRYTAPVGSFSANGFGLYNVHGNVSEWVADCNEGSCGWGVQRGGSWGYSPEDFRSAVRDTRFVHDADYRSYRLGFRVARTLTP